MPFQNKKTGDSNRVNKTRRHLAGSTRFGKGKGKGKGKDNQPAQGVEFVRPNAVTGVGGNDQSAGTVTLGFQHNLVGSNPANAQLTLAQSSTGNPVLMAQNLKAGTMVDLVQRAQNFFPDNTTYKMHIEVEGSGAGSNAFAHLQSALEAPTKGRTVLSAPGDVAMDESGATSSRTYCGCCGREGHQVAQCLEISRSGFVEGCPLCNGKHMPEDCATLAGKPDDEVANTIGEALLARKNMPPIMTAKYDWTLALRSPQMAPRGAYPWSRAYSRQMANSKEIKLAKQDLGTSAMMMLPADPKTKDRETILAGLNDNSLQSQVWKSRETLAAESKLVSENRDRVVSQLKAEREQRGLNPLPEVEPAKPHDGNPQGKLTF